MIGFAYWNAITASSGGGGGGGAGSGIFSYYSFSWNAATVKSNLNSQINASTSLSADAKTAMISVVNSYVSNATVAATVVNVTVNSVIYDVTIESLPGDVSAVVAYPSSLYP